jgi:competence protein ComFC
LPWPTARNLISTARSALASVFELIYPSSCGGCGTEGSVLCKTCIDSFVVVEPQCACPICGRWLGAPLECGPCGASKEKYFSRGLYGFHFDGMLREAIHCFKFQGRKDVGRALVRLVEPSIWALAGSVDVIVPLPVTERRLKERGFNQSFIIAEEIGRKTGKPIDYWTLFKTRETRDQYTLTKEERKKNIKGAFAVRKGDHLSGKTVLLVDDLYTTGNTAQEACRTLSRGGVEKIIFFALARTPA